MVKEGMDKEAAPSNPEAQVMVGPTRFLWKEDCTMNTRSFRSTSSYQSRWSRRSLRDLEDFRYRGFDRWQERREQKSRRKQSFRSRSPLPRRGRERERGESFDQGDEDKKGMWWWWGEERRWVLEEPRGLMTAEKDNGKDRNVVVVVVDTNIMIHSLPLIQYLSQSAGHQVYLPWKVLQELDGLQHREDTWRRAKKALIWLHEVQRKRCRGRIQMQDLNHQRAATESHLQEAEPVPDDRILATCILLKDQGSQVMLLTDDRCLTIKALANRVKVESTSSMKEMLEGEPHPEESVVKQDFATYFVYSCKSASESGKSSASCSGELLGVPGSALESGESYVSWRGGLPEVPDKATSSDVVRKNYADESVNRFLIQSRGGEWESSEGPGIEIEENRALLAISSGTASCSGRPGPGIEVEESRAVLATSGTGAQGWLSRMACTLRSWFTVQKVE